MTRICGTRLTLALVLVVALAACDGAEGDDSRFRVRMPVSSPTSETGPVIALVGTMSGPDAWRGKDAFEGVDVAIQVLNRTARPSELDLSVVGFDDEGDPERARELIAEAVRSPRVAGLVFAGPAEALARSEGALAEAGVPAMLVYGDLYSARLLRRHLFQVSPPYLWQARRIAPYLLDDRRYRRIGVIAQDSLMGETAIDALRTALRDEGGALAAVATYRADPDDLAARLERLKDARVEAVVFHGDPPDAARLFAAIDAMGANYVSTEAARTVPAPGERRGGRKARKARKAALRDRPWRPQIVGFDGMINSLSAVETEIPAGTVAADIYARGSFYLPVPSFQSFKAVFKDWWDEPPSGWQRRSYEATLLLGWAHRNTEPGEDRVATLERLRNERFGGLDVSFGPDDRTAAIPTTVGLWVVPRSGIDVREADRLPDGMPWVPLSRTFSTGGKRTDVLPRDWEHLFFGSYRLDGPAPKVTRARFGVTTTRRDPVH